MKVVIDGRYKFLEDDIMNVVQGNYVPDEIICNSRNVVEKITLQGVELVVKRYKRPNLINRFVYTFLRKTKARRAYEYALRLLAMEIDTPRPVAYVELSRKGLFQTGYFFSLHMPYELMRDAYTGSIADSEKRMLTKQFMDFTLSMHEKGVLPMDFNSSNIFYRYDEAAEKYCFALTDINRMRFGKVPSTSAVMRSFEQFGLPVEGLYKLAVYYCAQKGIDVEYAVFVFLFHRMKSRAKKAFKMKAKKRLRLL